jgi:anti-anti-sigma factor
VVTVTGEIDVVTVTGLRRELAVLVDDESVSSLVVDLSGVSFVGSSGLAELVEAESELDARGGTLRVVVGQQPAVVRAFTASGLAEVFSLFQDMAAALRMSPRGVPSQDAAT